MLFYHQFLVSLFNRNDTQFIGNSWQNYTTIFLLQQKHKTASRYIIWRVFFFFLPKEKVITLLVLWLKSSENTKCFTVLPVESIADAGVSYTLTAALLMEPAVTGGPHRLTWLLTLPQGVTLWHEGHCTVKVRPIRVLGHFLSLVCKRNNKLCEI